MYGMFENDGLMMEDMMLMSQHSEKFLNEQNLLNEEQSVDNFEPFNAFEYKQAVNSKNESILDKKDL